MTPDNEKDAGMPLDGDALHARRVRACRALIIERTLLAERLGTSAFPNPRWDVVLDLLLATLEGKQFYQSWLAPHAPPANAHRHSAKLEQLGIIQRTPDPFDHRRVIVELKPGVLGMMKELLDTLAVHWQNDR